jgi:5-methylcytosine-specific restriction endonuclease McrA
MAARKPDGKWTRGTTNSNSRGNARDRRKRKQFLLDAFGNGESCKCFHCPAVLTFATLNVDRVIPGWKGGKYTRDNIRPSCWNCGNRQGGEMGPEAKRAKQLVGIQGG